MIETTQYPNEVATDRAITGPDQPAPAADRHQVIRINPINPDRLNRRGRRDEEAHQRRFDRRNLRSLVRQDLAEELAESRRH